MESELRISLEKHPDTCHSPAFIDYENELLHLGTDVHSGDVEEFIIDILTHEYMHYILFKHFDVETARQYDTIYGEVEPKGRIIVMGFQGIG